MHKIFINYRRSEAEYAAGALARELRQHFGEAQVFRDKENINAGASWKQTVLNEIDHDSALLVLIGPQWASAANTSVCAVWTTTMTRLYLRSRTALTRELPSFQSC